MERKSSGRRPVPDYGEFVILTTREVGRVQLSESGQMSPVEAAFNLIGADDPGESGHSTYEFTVPFRDSGARVKFMVDVNTEVL